jgi:two-component system nitrate/nitrite response regulator NarL
MKTAMASIYIADDHSIVIDGIKSILANSKQFEVIGYSTDPKQVLNDIIHFTPDIVILDEYMQTKNGSEILQEVAVKRINTRFVFLSSCDDQNIMLLVKNLGAQAFIHKNVGAKAIIQVLEDVMDGKQRFDTLNPDFNPDASTTKIKKLLTPREMILLNLILKGMSNKQIAERLDRSKHTIATQRKTLYRKIKIEGYTNFSDMNGTLDLSKLTP